ncbi:unnamed protein product [Prunus armeniaca]
MASIKEKDKHKERYNPSPQLPRILPAFLSQKPIKTEPSPSSFPKTESTITPYPGLSPIPLVNRYSPLGSTLSQIRPNYQSALTSSYDPFQLPPTATPLSSSSYHPKTSPYVYKSTANLFIIEPHVPVSLSPIMIAQNHFPPGFHYLPHSPYKSLKLYREILHETKSVDIKPIRDKQTPRKSSTIPFTFTKS